MELDTTRDIDLDAEGEEEEPKTEDVEVPVEPEAPVEDSQVPEGGKISQRSWNRCHVTNCARQINVE